VLKTLLEFLHFGQFAAAAAGSHPLRALLVRRGGEVGAADWRLLISRLAWKLNEFYLVKFIIIIKIFSIPFLIKTTILAGLDLNTHTYVST
jgi:hypothetical protein